ncbi:hypothetical protein BTVI_146770 [Pitangus sulphuratus]|nr:hypothetical protein BTVI_146770 [Pitangus sulphuratus]
MAAPGSEKSSKKKTEKKLAAREEAKLLASFMGVMNNMRKQKTLCDVILMVQERKIPAHRVVLASASHFFNLMFTTNMIESKSFEVELKDAEPDIIEQLVEFAYTARISVNSNNVQSLLDAANQYQIEPVKKMCVDFLKEQVDASNCLGISVLAECLDCPELKATADDFIHQHFTEVYKTDEFLQLDVKRVTHLLNQDTLTVRAEDQVYDAAVRWLKYDEPNRQPYMVDILAKVRFPLISKNFLSKTVQAEPLIQDNPECLKMVISGMRYHLLSPEDREELVEGTRPRRKKHDYRIALFGGSQPQSCRYFNPKDYSWTDIRCPFEKRRDAACVFWDNVVYILGGSQLFPIKRMDCYNVVKDSWYSKLGPPTPRDSLAACAAEGKIYTSGGSEVGNSALYLFECYDTRTESWHTKPSMLTQRCSHGMVEANGLIYVCGGSLGNNVSGRVLNSCEVYDPATETWTELCPMIEARKNHGLVFVKDKIFAVGGQNGLGGLDNVEYYDIKMNEWKMVSPMPWKGVTVKCAAVGSVVYVLAGFQGVGRLGHILEYNTETDKWIANSKVRFSDVLPEELRLEYYNCRAKNIIGNYLSAFKNTGTKPLDWEESRPSSFGLSISSGRGGGGWGSSNQRYSNVIQPSTFKSDTWGGSRDHGRGFFGSSDFGSSASSSRNADFSQNRFSALANSQSVADGSKDEEERLLECVVKDMEIWESSGQWIFSSYSPMKEKMNVSGFSDVSPEELRLEYYDSRAKNMIGNYIDAVQQLAAQWKNRLLQLKALNTSTKAALLSAFKNTGTQPSPAFGLGGEQTSSFGLSSFPVSSSSASASGFSFKASSSLISSSSPAASPAAGVSSAAGGAPAFGVTSSPSASQPVGFGSPAAPSAASFSFKTAATAGGFGTSGFSGFGGAAAVNSSGTTTPLLAFGAFNAATATSALPSSGALFGQTASAPGHPVTSAPAAVTNTTASEKLFTPKSELSAEEWQQFEAKEFTIGKIPLKPPPLELLNAYDLLSLFRSNMF